MRILTDSDRQKVLTEALKWLDVSYKLRGNSKSGVDCSQFVMIVYQNALGINLLKKQNRPFLSSWLFLALKVICQRDLRIGDLVFYCREPRPIGRVATHVAIYIGHGNIIHASRKYGMVVIQPLAKVDGLLNQKDEIVLAQWMEEIIDP